jgi:hypothetical protein
MAAVLRVFRAVDHGDLARCIESSGSAVGNTEGDPVMEVLHYGHGDLLLQLDDHVLEVFHRRMGGALRVPLLWACANLSPHKRDLIHVTIGTTTDPEAPFYGPTSAYSAFDVPIIEEPRLRRFLDEAAHRAGR